MKLVVLALLTVTAGPLVRAQEPHVAATAPQDRPTLWRDTTAVARWERAIAPYVAQARASYPAARARYEAGLPPQESFFVTTRLHDADHRIEQVFIAVDSIRGSQIYGRIWSEISVVRGYRLRDPYQLPESEVMDWLITKPEGSEEGNFVGKFMDQQQGH